MSAVVIVTGSSRGIGAATARMASERGAAVCLSATTTIADAEKIAQSIRDGGGKAIAVRCDVSKEDDVRAMFAAVDRDLGRVTGLVNNAGITGPIRRVADTEYDLLERSFAINVIGSYICAREAVRRMSTKEGGAGGGIVNVSSRLSVIGGANEFVHYAACKGAIDSFTLGLAREVVLEGIRVNAVSPGLVDTEIHSRSGSPDRVQRILPTIPMRRMGKVEEVAEAILWLLSDASSYITGAVIPISGGR
jgi:NAD(P)-dependent dehydrogenase (short-subunit alcohol dehydrogenase family)